MRKESDFQKNLKDEIRTRLPGAIVIKLDANQIQGIPDLLILYKDRWGSLECKKSEKATHRPNQEHYVELMNDMSFSAFIFPENRTEVLDELQRALESGR
jgi:hypothetical protein